MLPRKRAGSRKRSERSTGARRGLGPVPGGRDLVADPPDGHDRRRLTELPSELAHVDVDGARIAGEGVAPDALEQLVARQHEAAVGEELPEEVELLRREMELHLGYANLAPAHVAVQVAVLDML